MKEEHEFFAELAKARDGLWQVVEMGIEGGKRAGALRHPLHYCPVMAVIRTRPAHRRSVDNQIYLDYGDLITEIIRAADNAPGHDERLRRRVLDTLGLLR